jgi:hypothetical protein
MAQVISTTDGETRMGPTYGDGSGGASVRDVLRVLRSIDAGAAGSRSVTQVTNGALLERVRADGDPPRLEPATVIEGDSLEARRPGGGPVVGFAAFLDGIQASRVVAHWAHGVPMVHGTVAAVIRARTDRRLATWRSAPLISRALYLPVGLADAPLLAMLAGGGLELVDTLDGETPSGPRHPLELVALARTAVQRRRESLEVALAGAWCAAEKSTLFIDGGISGAGDVARHPLAVGIVKSHRTLYATPDRLGAVTGLREGERTTGFVVPSPRRAAVASWYLRLRDPGGDPLFGLVRVEAALEGFNPARADLVSRWILAERSPLSLPDPRWSTMAYGIRDCEEYLRAVVGRG